MSRNELRLSQLLTTFGPGSMVDLPESSVIVGGLDEWKHDHNEPCFVEEPRLVRKLKYLLQMEEGQALFLRTPPPSRDSHRFQPHIRVYEFPEWFVVQHVEATKQGWRRRRLVSISALHEGRKFRDNDAKNYPALPVRFVRACSRGHIDDIDWYSFVHKGPTSCRKNLWMEERGTSGNLEETWVTCDCGVDRSMREASQANTLGLCTGRRPWLGGYSSEHGCPKGSRLLIRAASNTYFPQVLRVISIPASQGEIDFAVRELWDNFLSDVNTIEELQRIRQKPMPASRLAGFSDDLVMAAIIKFRVAATQEGPVKVSEVEALCAADEELGSDVPDGDFYARALPREKWTGPASGGIERVVLVHRLREVSAQVGFTRFEASGPDREGELDIDVERAPLGENVDWLPAIEIRGEGVFLQFSDEAMARWLARKEVQDRRQALLDGYAVWRQRRDNKGPEFPGLEYVMLHSLSHMLITAISLDCGYPSAALRERIYSHQPRYGILIYTATPDAEGTLGGLVETARDIKRHLKAALDSARLCSNDPVCSHHVPDVNDPEPLLGSACHGCLLIAETCCEQHNELLDRALVVPTLQGLGCEFFE